MVIVIVIVIVMTMAIDVYLWCTYTRVCSCRAPSQRSAMIAIDSMTEWLLMMPL